MSEPDPDAGLAALYPSLAKPSPQAAAQPSPQPSPQAPRPAAAPPVRASTWKPPDAPPAAVPPRNQAAPEDRQAQQQQQQRQDNPAAALYVAPASAAELRDAMALPPDLAAAGLLDGPEGEAARAEVRDAFLAAGASREEASDIWRIALDALRPGAPAPSYERAEAELRAAWGADYEARLSRARSFAKSAMRRAPRIAERIAETGLGNDARFIMAMEKAARRRGR